VIEEDLMRVIEESIPSGKMLAAFNTTFKVYSSYIPKADNPGSFEEFRPISLCNCIYKIIAKVIAIRVIRLLSTSTSGQKFEFLEGKQIHAAIREIVVS
jgi:hypothetical protein